MGKTKPCVYCGALLTKRYKDSAAEWAARKFCSRRCSAQTSPRAGRPAALRLSERTNKATGLGPNGNCWEWIGYKTPDGYGRMKDDRMRHVGAHRVAYEVAFGPLPRGSFVCHRCDNPACIKPAHLFLGDQSANMADMSVKGRAARGEKNFLAKLSVECVRDIRQDSRSNAELGRVYGVDASTISRIKSGQAWAHV